MLCSGRKLVPWSCTANPHKMVRTSGLVRAVASEFSAQLQRQSCHRDKSMRELWRGLTVLRLCGYERLTKNAEKLYSVAARVMGKRLTHGLLRSTFYHQLVAGEHDNDLRAASERLLKYNVKLMLCPPMEDIDGQIKDANPEQIIANTDRFIEYLEMAADLNRTQPGQLAVVQFKPTGVFPNELMVKYSQEKEANNVKLIDAVRECRDYAEMKSPQFSTDMKELTKYCMAQWMRLGQSAIEHQVPILVDGELRSTHYMLHALTLAMSAVCNGLNDKHTLIYGTYQCYMKKELEMIQGRNVEYYSLAQDTPAYLQRCVDVAIQMQFRLGAKIVRGAYLDRERAIAREQNQPDPTNATRDDTNDTYNSVVDTCLNQMATDPDSLALFIATMNKESVVKALHKLDQLNIPINAPHLNFGQIYGMCDHISFALGALGAKTYKSTPWGAVGEWVPYLSRRAAENHTALHTARNEVPLYKAEMRRRVGFT